MARLGQLSKKKNVNVKRVPWMVFDFWPTTCWCGLLANVGKYIIFYPLCNTVLVDNILRWNWGWRTVAFCYPVLIKLLQKLLYRWWYLTLLSHNVKRKAKLSRDSCSHILHDNSWDESITNIQDTYEMITQNDPSGINARLCGPSFSSASLQEYRISKSWRM